LSPPPPLCTVVLYVLSALSHYEETEARALLRDKATRAPKAEEPTLPHSDMYRRLRTVCKHVIRDETLDVLIDDLYAMRDRGWLPTWTRVPSEPATGAHSASESFSSSSSFPWIVEQEEAERQWAARLARSVPDSTDQYRTGAYFRKRPAPSVSRAPVRHWQLTPFANKSVIIVLGNEGGGRRRRRYLGHVFVWQDENLPATLDMIGIRTSLENLACRDYSQMAYRILAAVVAYATASVAGYRFLQVASPLPNMAALLARLAGRRTMSRYPIAAYPGVLSSNPLFELRALATELDAVLGGAGAATPATTPTCANLADALLTRWDAHPEEEDTRHVHDSLTVDASWRVPVTYFVDVVRESSPAIAAEFLRKRLATNPYRWYTPTTQEYARFVYNRTVLGLVFPRVFPSSSPSPSPSQRSDASNREAKEAGGDNGGENDDDEDDGEDEDESEEDEDDKEESGGDEGDET
jgi:hypothetical protein